MELGVVLFDSSEKGGAGWASKDGGLTTFRFKTPTDLINENVIYICNTSYYEHGQHSSNMPHLRRGGFFKTSLNQLLEEYSFNLDSCDRESAAKIACSVLSICGKRLNELTGFAQIYDAASSTIYNKIFKGGGYETEPEESIHDMCLSAWQETSSINHKFESGMVTFNASANKVRHAAFVLSHPTPAGTYKRTKHALSVVKALEDDSPSFYRVKIDWKKSKHSELCAFGVGWNISNKKVLREWVTQAELAVLTEFAPVEITEVIEFERWEDPIELPALLRSDEMIFSIVNGIVAESYLSAASSRGYQSKNKRHVYSPKSCWLRSIDRAVSLANANRLVKELPAINLLGYSYGSVQCRVNRSMEGELMEAAKACGFMTLNARVPKSD